MPAITEFCEIDYEGCRPERDIADALRCAVALCDKYSLTFKFGYVPNLGFKASLLRDDERFESVENAAGAEAAICAAIYIFMHDSK